MRTTLGRSGASAWAGGMADRERIRIGNGRIASRQGIMAHSGRLGCVALSGAPAEGQPASGIQSPGGRCATSQTRTVPSSLADAAVLPSGLNVTPQTESPCPRSVPDPGGQVRTARDEAPAVGAEEDRLDPAGVAAERQPRPPG